MQPITHPTDELHALESGISAVQFRKVKRVLIEDRHYHPEFIKHVLNAPNLEIVFFSTLEKHFTSNFYDCLLRTGQEKEELYTMLPGDSVSKFQLLLDDEGRESVTVTCDHDEEIDEDGIVTPEYITSRINDLKKEMKKRHYQTERESVNLKTDLSHQTPTHCAQLFLTIGYEAFSLDKSDEDVFYKNSKMDLARANQLVEVVAPAFVEFVVVIAGQWFLVCGYSTFLHDRSGVDDCANNSLFGIPDQPTAFIQRKTSFGKSFV